MFHNLNSREFANLYRFAVTWWRKAFEAFALSPTDSALRMVDEFAELLYTLEDERQYRHAR